MKKACIFVLTITYLMIDTNAGVAQDLFSDTFQEQSRPSKKNIRVGIEDGDGNTTYVPISIIKGREEGPVFTILAGVHGYEYPPIIAIQKVLREIDLERLSGTLVIIPITNLASFYGRSPFVNPVDKVNLNRAFPGDREGSITQRIADFITNSVIPMSDVFLDIHGGDANEDLLPFVCYYNNESRPEETVLAQRLAESSGFDYVVSYGYTLKDDQPAKYAFKQAVQRGKTGLSIESGKLGNVQKDAVELIVSGVLKMLAEMDMYQVDDVTDTDFTHLTNQSYISAKVQGILYSELRSGDRVNKGDIVGRITDEFGELLMEVVSPVDGIILYKIGTPPVNKGETLMCIASK